MSDFIPPFDGDFEPGIGGDMGGDTPPDSSYVFAGYFYTGDTGEVCLGVWLRGDALDSGTGIPPELDEQVNQALNQMIDGVGATLLGLDRLIAREDVPEDAQRRASGFLTIEEAFERGNRLPKGLDWGIYYDNGVYRLAIFGSG